MKSGLSLSRELEFITAKQVILLQLSKDECLSRMVIMESAILKQQELILIPSYIIYLVDVIRFKQEL